MAKTMKGNLMFAEDLLHIQNRDMDIDLSSAGYNNYNHILQWTLLFQEHT